MNKKPKIFLILKILGIIFLLIGITGIILTISSSGINGSLYMLGGMLASFGFFLGFACCITGFAPNMGKLTVKANKIIVDETEEDLKHIANKTADIASPAIEKTAQAIKTGLKDTKFCKNCGAKIDSDSKFCNKCGKQQ